MNLYFRFLRVWLASKRRKELDIWDTSRTPFRVLPNDLDALGHMNNGRYLTILDLARIDLMMRSGAWKRMSQLGWYPVVAGQTIAYLRSLDPWVTYDVHTRIIGNTALGTFIEQTFCVNDTVYAQAVVRARFLKKRGGKVSMEELDAFVGGVPDHVTLPAWVESWATANRAVEREFHSPTSD